MKPRPRLLFAVESPFSVRDWRRFGIDELRKIFDVFILDLTAIARPALINARGHDQLNVDEILVPRHSKGLAQIVAEHKPSVLLINIGVGELRQHLYELAHKHGVVTAEFQLGAIPIPAKDSSYLKPLVRTFRQLPSLRSIPSAIAERSKKLRFGDCLPDVFFRAGLRARGRHPQLGTSIVDVHSLDYETWLTFQPPDSCSNQQQVVYIDQNLGFHSDIPALGFRQPVDPRHFYPQILAYFEWIEDVSGHKVVVSPHPRTTIQDTAIRFPGFELSAQNTINEIVNGCSVIGHYSTSFSFAVLTKKPALIVTSDDLENSWIGPFVDSFAQELKAPTVNIDKRTTWTAPSNSLDSAQQDAYAKYVMNYLKSYDGPARKLWTMIGDELLQRVNG